MSNSEKFRLVTRSDFDGLVCAALLKELDLVEDILFVHPKDVQDGKIDIGPGDITTNLPYVAGCHLAFDHHESETLRLGEGDRPEHVIIADAPSAARVVYQYFGGEDAFPRIPVELMEAVDKGDAARFSRDEVLEPQGWVLLNFLMDARTGLGRFRTFRISNYQLMMQLIDYCRDHSVDQILALPDVAERVALYREHAPRFVEQLCRCTRMHGHVAVVDLREEDPIWAGNRFMVYALFPHCRVSVHVLWGLRHQNTVFAIGRSIINRDSTTNLGELCLEYGGGGHAGAGTCQVDNDRAAAVEAELVERLASLELAAVA